MQYDSDRGSFALWAVLPRRENAAISLYLLENSGFRRIDQLSAPNLFPYRKHRTGLFCCAKQGSEIVDIVRKYR